MIVIYDHLKVVQEEGLVKRVFLRGAYNTLYYNMN